MTGLEPGAEPVTFPPREGDRVIGKPVVAASPAAAAVPTSQEMDAPAGPRSQRPASGACEPTATSRGACPPGTTGRRTGPRTVRTLAQREIRDGARAVVRLARDRVAVIRRGGGPAVNAVETAEDLVPSATHEEAGRVVHIVEEAHLLPALVTLYLCPVCPPELEDLPAPHRVPSNLTRLGSTPSASRSLNVTRHRTPQRAAATCCT